MTYKKTNSEAYEIYLGGKDHAAYQNPTSIIKAYGMRHADRSWITETLKNRAIVAEIERWIMQDEYGED